MKVAIFAEQLCRRPSGGIGVYTKQLIRSLSRLSDVDSFAISSRGSEAVPDVSWRYVGPPHRATAEVLSRGLPLPGWRTASRDADMIHATSFDLPPRDSRPLTVFVHDLLWREWPHAYSQRGISFHERGLERALSRAAKLLVPSNAVAQVLIAAGAPATNVVVVAEGSDHLPLEHRIEVGDVAPGGIYGSNPNEGFFLSVGTNQPRKNLPGLFAAYGDYRSKSQQPLPLRVVGPSGWGPDLGPPASGVAMLGAVSDRELAALYASAQALIFVPFAEGFGLPIGEAWRAGTPIISSTGVPLAEQHPDACALVSPSDKAAIIEAITAAENDSEARRQRVARGIEIAANHTWRTTAVAHLNVWKQL